MRHVFEEEEHGHHGHECGCWHRGWHYWRHRYLPLRGLLHLLILRLLEEKPLYGSEIREALRSRLDIDVPASAVYAILAGLEEKGMVTSKWETGERGAARKLYSATEYGLEYLKERVEDIRRFKRALDFLTA